jgi:hypothetical protein
VSETVRLILLIVVSLDMLASYLIAKAKAREAVKAERFRSSEHYELLASVYWTGLITAGLVVLALGG